MTDIKIGDYIRCGSAGIRRVTALLISTIDFSIKGVQDEKGLQISRKYIKKHSEDILDLIQVGDYVNGRLVLQVDYKNKNVCLLIPSTDTTANTHIMWYGYEDIKSILTKEQYERNCFKVVE